VGTRPSQDFDLAVNNPAKILAKNPGFQPHGYSCIGVLNTPPFNQLYLVTRPQATCSAMEVGTFIAVKVCTSREISSAGLFIPYQRNKTEQSQKAG
jgi:hypothetical protein